MMRCAPARVVRRPPGLGYPFRRGAPPPDHGRGQLSAARLARRSRCARQPPSASHARAGDLAAAARAPRAGAGRRDRRRDPRHGAGGDRHHHRRRDQARELLQPLRDRARRDGPRPPGHRARSHRPPQPGAACRRTDPADSRRSRCRDVQFLRANTDHKIKATLPGPVHDVAAGAGRLLPRRGGARDGASPRRSTRRCATSSPPAPTWSSSTSLTCRPGRRRRSDSRSRRSIARSRGSRARRRCTRASATRTSFIHARTVIPFLEELADVNVGMISMESAQQKVDLSVLEEPRRASG